MSDSDIKIRLLNDNVESYLAFMSYNYIFPFMIITKTYFFNIISNDNITRIE